MWMLVGIACDLLVWPSTEHELGVSSDQELRRQSMTDHQIAVHRARDAVIAQDLDGVHRAGEGLAVGHDVRGLPEAARRTLQSVREAGAELARLSDLDQAATLLVELTASCARCHTMLDVPPKLPAQATQRDLLWTALEFRSEELWEDAAQGDPALLGLRYWDDRVLAVGLRLQGGAF